MLVSHALFFFCFTWLCIIRLFAVSSRDAFSALSHLPACSAAFNGHAKAAGVILALAPQLISSKDFQDRQVVILYHASSLRRRTRFFMIGRQVRSAYLNQLYMQDRTASRE